MENRIYRQRFFIAKMIFVCCVATRYNKQMLHYVVSSLLALSISASVFAAKKSTSKKVTARKPAVAQVDTSLLQKILNIEDQRTDPDHYLSVALKSPSPSAVKKALLAMARLAEPNNAESLAQYLLTKGKPNKALAAFALGQMSHEFAYTTLTQNQQLSSDLTIRAACLLAIGQSGNTASQNIFRDILKQDPVLASAALEGVGRLWGQAEPKSDYLPELISLVAKYAREGDLSAYHAAFAFSRFKGSVGLLPTEELLTALDNARREDTKVLLARTLAKIKQPRTASELHRHLLKATSVGFKLELVKGLRQQTYLAELAPGLTASLQDPSPAIKVETLETLATLTLPDGPLVNEIEKLATTSTSLWVQKTALRTLAKVRPALAKPLVAAALASAETPLFPTALIALSVFNSESDTTQLGQLLGKNSADRIVPVLETLVDTPPSSIAVLKPSLLALLARNDVALTSNIAALAESGTWEDFGKPLAAAYPKLVPQDLEAKVAILKALGKLGDKSVAPLLEAAVADKDRPVAMAAAVSLKQLTGKDLTEKVPLNSVIAEKAPYFVDVQQSVGKEVVLKTSRGAITFKMLDSGPVTAYRFLKLVREGFYAGKTFHRVVPGFVAQGGDPRGDGYGGPGYFIRDEVSPEPHKRGSIGIATAGKDTGGSQLFINLADNPHLVGRYTVFASVVGGMEVADKLEAGDKIISAQIR